MNKDLFEGKWHEYKGKVKEKWGKLTDNDLTQINGKREALIGKLQTHYGYAKDQAESELEEFESSSMERETHRMGQSNRNEQSRRNEQYERNAQSRRNEDTERNREFEQPGKR